MSYLMYEVNNDICSLNFTDDLLLKRIDNLTNYKLLEPQTFTYPFSGLLFV